VLYTKWERINNRATTELKVSPAKVGCHANQLWTEWKVLSNDKNMSNLFPTPTFPGLHFNKTFLLIKYYGYSERRKCAGPMGFRFKSGWKWGKMFQTIKTKKKNRMGRLHKHMYVRLFRTNDGIHLGSSFKAFTFPPKIKLLHRHNGIFSLRLPH
jgi:hypothetical protein